MLPINYFVRNEILVHVNKYSWHNRKATHLKYKKYFKGTIFEIITYIKDNEAPKTICLTVVPRLGYKQHIKISKRYFLWSCRLWLHILLGSFLDEQISIAIWENYIFFPSKNTQFKNVCMGSYYETFTYMYQVLRKWEIVLRFPLLLCMSKNAHFPLLFFYVPHWIPN